MYYRGNSLAVIVFRPADMYRIEIHERFLAGLDQKTREEFTLTGSYRQVTVDARGAHRILQRRNVAKLMKAIRDVNHSEELAFGRSSSRTTLRPRGFLLIDRQVTDHHMHRLDLLGLRRLESGRYGFVVIEVKLGKNGELSEAVAEQLEHYVWHIRDAAPEAYAPCYEKTYAQKRRLGLIAGPDMPDEIEIDGSEVEGLVVVGGYTQEAMAQAQRLKVGHQDLRVHIFRNSLVGEGGALVGA